MLSLFHNGRQNELVSSQADHFHVRDYMANDVSRGDDSSEGKSFHQLPQSYCTNFGEVDSLSFWSSL